MVAAAIVGVGIAGAVGTVAAGAESANAITSSTNAAISEQQQALQQQAQLAQPYTGVGQAAIPLYEQLLGIGGGGSAGIQAALASTPGYQFALGQGETGIENAASTAGGISGNTLADLDKYNVGLASGTYQSVLGDVQGAVGIGQAAAAGQASNIGTAASNISTLTSGAGQSIAGIDANTIAGITKSIGNAGNNYVTMQYLNALNS